MRVLPAVLTVVMMTTGLVQASTYAGMREVQLQGSLKRDTNDQSDDETISITGQLGYNYFLSPRVSLGCASVVSVSMTIPEDSDQDETYTTLLFLLLRANLYLTSGAGKVVPYIGAQGGAVGVGYKSEDYDDTTLSVVYGAFGGLKIFATENTSWNAEGGVLIYEYDTSNSDSIAFQTISVTLGFSYYF